MFAQIVFPLADFRDFAADDLGKLKRPVWPTPLVQGEFVRAIGPVRQRRRGGLSGWLGESEICVAIRLGQLSLEAAAGGVRYRRRIAFRRYFSDGRVLHRFDVGLSIQLLSDELHRRETQALLGQLLCMPATSPGFEPAMPVQLFRAGSSILARRLTYATTASQSIDKLAKARSCIYPGGCALYLEIRDDRERVEPPRYARAFAVGDGSDRIRHWIDDATGVPVFALYHRHEVENERIRNLRLLVTRLWSEAECLGAFATHAGAGRLAFAARDERAQRLQDYLDTTTRRLRRMRRQQLDDTSGGLYDEALEGLRQLRPGRIDGLLETLRILDVRKNLMRDVERVATDVRDPAERPSVFISYSHSDAKWLQRLQIFLKPLERDGRIDRWDDTRIRPGDQWRREIEAGLARAHVAVLLISADFLASDFIANEELPSLLDAAEQRGTTILCVILSPSSFQRRPELVRYQAVNCPTKPLIGLKKADQERVFDRVAQIIEEKLV